MDKLLTIIVPVYKVEKYINKCLDSLIVSEDQMKKLEVIIVNDGTPDNSAIMAKVYENRYPKVFQVIDKENGGHGSAWNKGMELATGKYLRFLDSDDWLTNLSEFMEKLERYDVDLIFTGVRQVFEDGRKNKLFKGVGMAPDTFTMSESFDWSKTNKMYNGHNFTNFHTCTYKTDLLKPHHPIFFEKMFYDDEILFVLPLCFAKSFVYFDMVLYNYLLGRAGQTMDRKVAIQHIDFKIKIRKHETLFYKANMPKEKSVNDRIMFNLNSRHRNTFILLTALAYRESLCQMKDMDSWLAIEYPEFDGGKMYALYKNSPSCYWFAYNYLQPVWAIIKKIIK